MTKQQTPPTILKQWQRVRVPTVIEGESLTRQAHQQECDINQIMAKWQKTGIIEHVNEFEGQYGDFTDLPADYQSALNQVMAAQEMFESLPSTVRRKFDNDPGKFLEFVDNPENAGELVEMGLAHSPVPDPSETANAPQSGSEPLSAAKKSAGSPPDAVLGGDEKPSKPDS